MKVQWLTLLIYSLLIKTIYYVHIVRIFSRWIPSQTMLIVPASTNYYQQRSYRQIFVTWFSNLCMICCEIRFFNYWLKLLNLVTNTQNLYARATDHTYTHIHIHIRQCSNKALEHALCACRSCCCPPAATKGEEASRTFPGPARRLWRVEPPCG